MIPAIQEIGFGPGTEKAYATLHQATVSFAEMGERTISTQVRIDGDVVPDFDGWEVSFKGERFILNTKDPQAVKDNSTRNSLVDLTFVSWVVNELKRYFFFEPTSIDSSTAIADKYKASVNVPVEDFAVLFNKVLDYYFDGKVVFSLYMSGQGQYSTDRALVEIDYTYIWDVLVKFFEIYGVRWRIEHDNTNDVYTIKAGWPTTDIDINDHDFEYGYKGGLLRFERQVQDVDIHNILLGRGGEKNIPYRYFKRIDPQNPDWAADPDAIPELSNIYFDRLRDINFRWYVRGWMQNPNHDTSWEEDGYVYPTYTIASDSPYYFAYQKGLTDEKFNPVEYVKDDESIADYGEHWGALDDNDDIFPTIQGVTRDPLGRIDETVAVSEIVTDDIEAMAENAAIEKSINRLTISLDGETETVFDRLSEEFTIPSGSTGNITYVPVGTDEVNPGLVRFDTENSTVVAVADGTEYPIDALPAGTYRLKLHMVIARSGQATSATGTFGIENIVLTTSSMDTDAWKPTFDIWVKNIWGTTKGQDENDIQYAERVWLPILGDRAGNEAKIVFSSGFMSVSEDYEFTIVSYPVYDTSKSINGVPSEWRITLRKSDAEFDATGLYIPNASTGGQPVAGDKFFFIGIDMPFRYVELAEEDLNTNKEAQLDTEATISPTWIMNLDKVRVHTLEDQEYGQTLADRLAAGGKVWIKDKRFTPGQRLQLYVQSITYTWNEPSDDSPYIVPDIEVVLSDKVVAVDSVVQRIQNDVSSIKNQYARISDVEAVVRSVAEPIFLKKTGESDSSDSPTQFSSKVTSKGFRQGAIGGTGWGIYRDNTSAFATDENEQPVQTRGTRSLRALRANVPEQEEEADAVIEADRIVVRKELQVNSLVINQIAYVGGKEIISAAKIEVSKVIETADGYICYFDQRRNSVANNFAVNDIAFGQVFNPDNTEQRYYKMVVTATDVDCITLSKSPKDGSGAPKVGDIIVQYGNTTNADRQYVIVRDVIGGGYERMLSGLSTVSSTGKEYYFAGRQNNSGPRWFVGDSLGDYAEYEDGVLTIKANVIFKAGQEIPGLSDLETQVDNLEYLHTALPKSDTIISGGLILSKVIALRDSNNAIKSGINGDPTLSSIAAWYGGPMADKEATPTPASYAQTLFRFDGSGYLAGGTIFWNNQGYGGIPGVTWSRINGQDVVSIGANVQLESLQGADSSVTDLIDAVNSLADLFEVVNGNVHVKNNRGFYSDSFISAGGLSDSGGTAGGNASMQLISGGGRITNGTDTLDVYSMSRVDQLLASAGTVQTVAGVSPSNGDIPVASLQTALSLGAAAYKAVGSVVSGNTGLVTGGDVWTAIDNLPEPMVFKGSLGTGGTITSLPAASSANEGFTYKVITAGTYRGTAAKVGDTFISNGSSWVLIPSGDEPEGTVTSVGLTMPTGFSVGSSPITSSGTLAVTFASGYSLPTTAKQSNWDTAYGWGNHANAGYLLATTAANTYATISALNGVSGRVTTLENRTNWDTYFGIDDDGNVYVKKNGTNPRGFYSYGFVSAGGASSGGGSAGVDLSAVWQSLKTNTDDYANQKINAYHIPIGTGLEIQNGLIVATNSGTVTGVSLAAGATNGTLHLVVNGTAQSDVEVTGLGSLAYKSSLVASDIPDLSGTYQPKDADLTAIAGLSGTFGFLKKTAANTWALDSNTYLTGIDSTMVTNALGYTPANSTALANYLPLTGGYIQTTPTDGKLRLVTSGDMAYIQARTSTSTSGQLWLTADGGGTLASVHLQAGDTNLGTTGGCNLFLLRTSYNYIWAPNQGGVIAIGVQDRGETSAINACLIVNQYGAGVGGGTLATADASLVVKGTAQMNTALISGYTSVVNSNLLNLVSNYPTGEADRSVDMRWRNIYDYRYAYARTYFSPYGVPTSLDLGFTWDGTETAALRLTYDYSSRVVGAIVPGQTEVGSLKLSGTNASPTLSWDATAGAWKLSGNFYATGWVSAGGVSSGGGSGGIDADAMWALLANTDSSKKINVAHLPDLSGTYFSYKGSGNASVSAVSTLGIGSYSFTSAPSGTDTTPSQWGALNVFAVVGESGYATSLYINNDSTRAWLRVKAGTAVGAWHELAFKDSSITGNALTATDADKLDGQHGSYYAAASSLSNYLPLTGGYIQSSSSACRLRLVTTDTLPYIQVGTASASTANLTVSGMGGEYGGLLSLAFNTVCSYGHIYVGSSDNTAWHPVVFRRSNIEGFVGLSDSVIQMGVGTNYINVGSGDPTFVNGTNSYTIFHSGNYTSYVNTTNFPGLNKTGTVTKVSTGTGLTGGDITSTGTISINTTYQGYITHGESAYNSLGNYVLKAGDTMSGNLTISKNDPNIRFVQGSNTFMVGQDANGGYIYHLEGAKSIMRFNLSSYLVTFSNAISVSGMTTTGAITSTLATGTAPFTIASTTRVVNLNADLLDGQEGSYYATASSVTTLQGYFTNGVANSAAKLTTVSKTAWGQTYWTANGVPDSISGNMTGVGSITMTGGISITNTAWTTIAINRTNIGSGYFGIDGNGLYTYSANSAGTSSTYTYLKPGVGLGIGKNPSYALDVSGTGYINGDLYIQSSSTGGRIRIVTSGDTSYIQARKASSAAGDLYITGEGGGTLNTLQLGSGTVTVGSTSGCNLFLLRTNYNYIWANNAGGVIAIGVKDKGETSGVNAGIIVNQYGVGINAVTANSSIALNVNGTASMSFAFVNGGASTTDSNLLTLNSSYPTGSNARSVDMRWRNNNDVRYAYARTYFQAYAVPEHLDFGFTWDGTETVAMRLNYTYTSRAVSVWMYNLHIGNQSETATDPRYLYLWKHNSSSQALRGLIYETDSGLELSHWNATTQAGFTSLTIGVGSVSTSGNFVASGAITAGAASDARLKTNISTLSDSDAKALIMALRPVTFTWNDKATELYDQYKGDDLGFVAQEVENVLPVAIGTIFEKYKRLDQTKFIAPLVVVAKDHETRIEKLEKEVKARDAKIMELENEVKRLRMN